MRSDVVTANNNVAGVKKSLKSIFCTVGNKAVLRDGSFKGFVALGKHAVPCKKVKPFLMFFHGEHGQNPHYRNSSVLLDKQKHSDKIYVFHSLTSVLTLPTLHETQIKGRCALKCFAVLIYRDLYFSLCKLSSCLMQNGCRLFSLLF